MVVLNYYPSVGGTQIFFQKIAEQFVSDYKDDVQVFTIDSYYGAHKLLYKKIALKNETINGVKVSRFSFRRNHKRLFLIIKKITLRLFKKEIQYINRRLIGPWSPSLDKAIRQTDADIIIGATSTIMYMDYALKRYQYKNPKPFIFQGAIHFKNNLNDVHLPSYVISSMKAADIYWSNTFFESKMVRQLGVDANKIKLTGIGVDLKSFEQTDKNTFRQYYNIDENEILIVYLGRIEVFKNIDLFIQAIEDLFKMFKNFRIIIAGKDFGYLSLLKQLISSLDIQIQNKIILLESISDEEKSNLCNAMNMLVLPSVNESFGMVFLEAWACRKPVIGADIGAVASVLNNEHDGLLFEAGNYKSLSAQMLKLAKDKTLRDKFGKNGYQKVAEKYTWQIIASVCRNTFFNAIDNFENISITKNKIN